MHILKELILTTISNSLKHSSITTCSQWACAYRMMGNPFPGPWTFKYHPWLQEMHDDNAEIIIGQKGAQVGFTEWAMNVAFYSIDILNIDTLYIFPSSDDASDFSAGRFDPALENSIRLKTLFSDVKNVGHKRAGQNNLYIRGSRSRSKLKSIPCGLLIFDEVDEMNQQNIPLALERASGQVKKNIVFISTPTVEDFGINVYFKDSTQEHFYFICPHCHRYITFEFPDSLNILGDSINDPSLKFSHYQCTKCKGKLEHAEKSELLKTGIFVPDFSGRESHGYTISQMFSSAVGGRPVEIAKSVIKAENNPTEATELYNSKLGQTYEVEGARITDTQITACIGNYLQGPGTHRIVTMGIDVGNLFHYTIDEWLLPQRRTPGLDINDEAIPRTIKIGSCKDTIELSMIFKDYNVTAAVIDRYPEQRIAFQFASQFRGRILLCMYGRGLYGKQVQMGTEDELTITVDRTSWLDLSLGRFKNHRISLPKDLPLEYRKHLREPVRIYEKDSNGNPIGRYVSARDDHFAHARNYSEIALIKALSFGRAQDITRSPR